MDKLTHVSLFSGIGGNDLAAEWAGFESLLFCEINPFSREVLRKHWPNVPIIEDVHNVKANCINQTVTLLTAGVPCQPASTAGKRRGKADDRWLWPEAIRILAEIRSTWAVFENPTGIISLDEYHILPEMENTSLNNIPSRYSGGADEIYQQIEQVGYEVQPILIPACAVNAPHRRDRLFIIAHLQSMDEQSSLKAENNREFQGYIQPRGHFASTWLQVAPTLCRVDDGFPSRLDKDRLKALGNAVVPQQVYPIFKAIAEIEANR